MDKQAIVDGYKSLEEWAKWLVTIETALCAGLWPKLTGATEPPVALYLGWTLFVGSIITTAIMLVLLAFFIQRVHTHAEKDVRKVKILVAIQYGFFLGGVVCFTWRVLSLWLG
jgi:hypothetical protein